MCTGIELTATNGHVFWGRTMDIGLPMFHEDKEFPNADTAICTIPAGIELMSAVKSWRSKYAVVGVGLEGTNLLFDGINEHGLTGDMQVLMETTYDSIKNLQERQLTPVLGEEFVTYILTHFKSVQEVKEHYQEFGLVDMKISFHGTELSFPLHYTFVDGTGASVVLEATKKGAFEIYENVGVMTNSPEYAWHTTNIRNYISLQNVDHPAKKINEKITLATIENGVGSGLTGLPGDYTSASRFVRAFFVSKFMDAFEADNGMNQLYAAFRAVIIPRGLEHPTADTPLSDFTRYWVGYDIENRALTIQTGVGLAFTYKKLNPEIKEIRFEKINTGNE